jgi:hypothetical protein
MSVLISLALGAALAAGASAAPARGSAVLAAVSAPSRSHPRTPQWVRPPSPVSLAALVHARFSRRAGVSRVERGVTSLGARTAAAPHVAWTSLAGSGEPPARSRRAAATFERGPPPLS